jgi:hypothetical protein
MDIDFVPTLAVSLSLGACALLPVLLVVISHQPLKVARPGQRFLLAAGLTWVAWMGAMILVAPDPVDLVTGGLLLGAATLAGFTLWTLIAWGFTLSMLLVLEQAGRPLTVDEWALAYTNGKPLAAFARDRLGVLFLLGLAQRRGGAVEMSPGRGRLAAGVVVLLRKLFKVPA